MDENTLNAVLLSIGAVAVVWSFVTASLLFGVLIVLFLLAMSLLHRLVTAVERIADNTEQLAARPTDGGRTGSRRQSNDDRAGEADWDDAERPPVEERSTDELFE
ncbi:hypothetical protein [Haloarchaeobius iranensis]|uniref:Uncharacterized protein n=1 Tax=Haloarchaeobius iranensis TaxID=996166 RepID=A0A1G9SL41_9EURY|nr:hypothetical protein [Haloarchaeobius iranensis]SDM35505.1 hypothetical protein SAMN05192554_101217 [Haloarchaeobius iranensis]